MDYKLSFNVNEHTYLRNPESSEIGKRIVKNAIDLIYKMGFEQFTFKKLAVQISTTEATVYRYFENKHRLLLYILNWYWSYMEYLVEMKLQNVANNKEKLESVLQLLTHELPESMGLLDYNKKYLNQIVIAESSKSYLVKDVSKINKEEVFKPYKDLCASIAAIISAYNPLYKFPRSLSSTLIEASHQQQFFSSNLPRLTDLNKQNENEFTYYFLSDFVFRILNKE